jgi:N utilization substance protein B
MATRTQARESVIGLLYAYDLGNEEIAKFSDMILEERKIRNKQKQFALNLFNGVINNLKIIDKELLSHLTKEINKVSFVDKAILRLGIYEILFTQTDKPVIINEAVELAKRLSGEKSPAFINGLLDKIKR